jgi:hypothetical protein
MFDLTNIDQIVLDILAGMPMKEKAIITNLDEDKVPYLQYAFDVCIRGQIGKDDEMSRMSCTESGRCYRILIG